MKNPVKKYLILFFFAFVVISINSINSFAQNTISGIVFDNNRRPVTGITVELLDEYERLIRQVRTAYSGFYQFQSLRQGNYYIQINAGGTNFKAEKERIQLGQGNRTDSTGRTVGSEYIQQNFYLQLDPRRTDSINSTINEVVFAQEIPDEARKFYEDALSKFEDKRRDEAIDLLNKAITVFPDYFLALDRLGNEYLVQNKFVEAENIFKKAIEINKNTYSAKYGLGAAQYQLKKYAEAENTLQNAVVTNPTSINAFYLLGKVQRELKKFEKSETNLLKAKKLSNNSLPDIHWELALLYYYNLKRYNEAADELELYLKANPKAENKEQVKKLIKTFRTKAKEEKP